MNTPTSETIIIKLSRKKIVLTILGAILFVLIGIWMVAKHQEIDRPIDSPLFVLIMGIIAILFFGFIAITAVRKLSTQSDGLIISSKGVTDNSSGISAGFIPWEDITAITETAVVNQNFVNIVLKDPEAFIASQKNSFKRKAMTANYKTSGSAVAISANSLDTTHENLKKILVEKLTEYNRMNHI